MPYERAQLRIQFADGSISDPFYRPYGLKKAILQKLQGAKLVSNKHDQTQDLSKLEISLPQKASLKIFTMLHPDWKPQIMSLGHDALVLLHRDRTIKDGRQKWGAHIQRLYHYGFILPTVGDFSGKLLWNVTPKGEAYLNELSQIKPSQYRCSTFTIAQALNKMLHRKASFEIKVYQWACLGLIQVNKSLLLLPGPEDFDDFKLLPSLTEKGKNLITSHLAKLWESSQKLYPEEGTDVQTFLCHFISKDQIPLYFAKYPDFISKFKQAIPELSTAR